MNDNDESRDRGWEDLFGPLGDGAPAGTTFPEPGDSEPRSQPEPAPASATTGPFDPSALYSALQEDLAAETPQATAAPSDSEGPAAPADASTGLTRRELREQRAAATAGVSTAPVGPPAEAPSAAPTAPPAPPAPAAFPVPSFPAPAVPDGSFPPSAAFAPSLPAVQHATDLPHHAPVSDLEGALVDTPSPVPEPAPEPLGAPVPEPVPWDPAPELHPDTGLPPTAAMPVAEPAVVPTVPVSYDAVETAAAAQPPAIPPIDGAFPMRLDPPPPGRRGGRSLRWLAWFIPVVIVVAAAVGGGVYAWTHYEDKVRQILGLQIPDDYSGEGNGESVVVTIKQGDTGSDIALALYQAGVTMSWKSFSDLANRLAHSTDCASPDPNNGCWPVIQFGNYNLQKQMSAQAALDALQDPANKVTNNLVIPEGSSLSQTLDIISATTGISLDDLKAAAADPGQFGAANPANSLEGYLFPDTYQLDGSETATSILQRLVNQTFAKLDALGVAADQRHAFLTGASIVQKESGPIAGDAAKVARVFQNRLAQGMRLQSDATVAYGAGVSGTVWTTTAQRNDASNPYNTYARDGLPIGPIGAPGAVAMDAWLHPADGPWLYFVAVNLKTGETVFSTSAAEHNAAVDQLGDWCNANAENAAYCK